LSSCAVRLPADNLTDDVDVAMATASAPVPSDTLGTVPSNDTVVSHDTVLCGDDMALDVSSQSVEIITNEESNLLDLDLQATCDVTDLELASRGDSEGQFMTAEFYIGESLPSSPRSNESSVTAATRKVRHQLSINAASYVQFCASCQKLLRDQPPPWITLPREPVV